jgi:hypothetical protein
MGMDLQALFLGVLDFFFFDVLFEIVPLLVFMTVLNGFLKTIRLQISHIVGALVEQLLKQLYMTHLHVILFWKV